MPKTSDKFKRTTVSLHEEEYEALRFMAFKKRTSIAGVLRELILQRLEDEEDIKDGLKALETKGDSIDWSDFKKEFLGS